VCDHSARFYCLSQRLLPEGFDPKTYVRGGEGVHPFAMPPSGTMGPTDVLTAYGIPCTTPRVARSSRSSTSLTRTRSPT
jgi:hypothetical protein